MRMNGKMQKTMLRVLSVMLAASFLLAVVGLAWPKLALAEHYCYWVNCQKTTRVSCGNGCGLPVGTEFFCYYCKDRKRCCDAYHCWWTNEYSSEHLGRCWCADCR